MWKKWFVNGVVKGIEYYPKDLKLFEGLDILIANGYCQETLDKFENDYFDYIIEDGPHTLKTQMYFAVEWAAKIKVGGKLIIEDIKSLENANKIIEVVDSTKYDIKLFDMTTTKNRYDDIIVEITKK